MTVAIAGGLPVLRPRPLVIRPEGVGLRLISDNHIGAANGDYDLQVREMTAAVKARDRILLGGDVFDLILPCDRKRYTPDALHPRLRGRSDIVNEAVEWAVEMFSPFAPYIDVIGIGNHESASLQRHNYDAVGELVRRLNDLRTDDRPPILQAGYCAYVTYAIKAADGERPVARYVVWYHHGTGKSTKSHTALGKLIEQTGAFAADLYWSGHSHSRSTATEVMIHAGRDGKLTARDVRCVVTGSYLVPYGHQSQESMTKKGRRLNYAAEAGVKPHGLGGARVVLHWDGEPGFPSRVEVVQ